MTKPRPTFSWDQIDAIHARAGMVEDDVPECAFNAIEYAARYKLPRKTAENRLTKLVRAGELKTGKRMARLTPNGCRGLMRFYWPA